jgi:pimeloyl-ACP methyl ester carboxylesterase
MSRLLLLACACLLLTGYAWSTASTSLSERLVAPGGVSPLLPEQRIAAALAKLPNRSGRIQTPAGVPLFWRAIDPGDYRMRYRFRGIGSDAAHPEQLDFSLDFSAPRTAPATPRGTVILLHGWMMDGDSLLPWALQLAQAGYRSISIDLRNHGQSGHGAAGYGTREAADVAAAIATLRQRGEVVGPLYLFGVSYGAATAVFTAQALGDEVNGVVAMESFANAGRGIRDMLPHMLTITPVDWRAWVTMQLARWRYGHQDIDAVIAAANAKLALNLDQVDVAAALAKVPACVLLLHGDADEHIPVSHGRRLASASARARYLEIAGENHLSLPMRLDTLGATVDDWFAQTRTAGDACPQPQLPG